MIVPENITQMDIRKTEPNVAKSTAAGTPLQHLDNDPEFERICPTPHRRPEAQDER